MIKTLAQAKKDFTKGAKFKVIENNFKPERVGAIGTITETFTNKFEYLDSITGKIFTFWWGTTKENKYQNNILTTINLYDNDIAFRFELI